MDMVLIVLMNFEKHDINTQLIIARDFAYKYKIKMGVLWLKREENE